MGGGGVETPLWTMLKIPSSKTKTDGYSTWVFFYHPWKFHFFFSWLLEFPHALSSIYTPGNSMSGIGTGINSPFQVLKFILLIKIYKTANFCSRRYCFLQDFRTSFNITWKKIFVTFSIFNRFTQTSSPPKQPKSVKFDKIFLLMLPYVLGNTYIPASQLDNIIN